jgi:hypothetical protein
MKLWTIFLFGLLHSTVFAQDCNTDSRQSLWIERINLSLYEGNASTRISYQAPQRWSTALPELGLVSYWTEDQQLSQPHLHIKSKKGSLNEQFLLKKVSKEEWRPKEGEQGFTSELDLNTFVAAHLENYQEDQLILEVRIENAVLCRHVMNISRIIDQ